MGLRRAFFAAEMRHFSHSVQLDVSAHFSALDDEEFFVVEGSGWRGRRESDSPGVLPPELVCMRAVVSTKTLL